ncbi:ATP-binding cassette domain-containing protein [Bacillus sp. FSL W7-1360]
MNTMILNGVKKRYGKKAVLADISVVLKNHQFVVLLGENGIGKTTLLKLCAGLIPYDSGEVLLNEARTRQARAQTSVYVSDEVNMDPFLTLKKAIEVHKRMESSFDQDQAIEWCNQLALPLAEKVTTLSTGQRHLFSLVLAAASSRPIIFIDELLANLDSAKKEAMIALLTDVVTDQSRLVVMASHAYEEVELLADGAIFLHANGVEVIKDIEEWRQEHGVSLKALFSKVGRS